MSSQVESPHWNQEGRGKNWCGAMLIAVGITLVILFVIFWDWKTRTFPEDKDIDVTDKSELRQGIIPGATYLVSTGLYLEQYQGRYALTKPFTGQIATSDGIQEPKGPKSQADYERTPSRWPQVVCFPGTQARFRVDRIYLYTSFATSAIHLTGKLTDNGRDYENVTWYRPELGAMQQ